MILQSTFEVRVQIDMKDRKKHIVNFPVKLQIPKAPQEVNFADPSAVSNIIEQGKSFF